jgi:transposase
MRGDERVQDGMFSYVSLEQRVPVDHPLRGIRKLTDAVLSSLDAEFDKLYKDSGRPSIAPEYNGKRIVCGSRSVKWSSNSPRSP